MAKNEDAPRYKYIVNGDTYYHSLEELRAKLKAMHEKSGPIAEEQLDIFLRILLDNLNKYDGDPYGFCKGSDMYKIYHEALAKGIMIKVGSA